ncbi:Mediator of RNA polymerase II transcription subunit 4 [Echinococcus granulosus]|nr:Mediator of RNA polymerase II transcription subunit 4 [Echinococcus granulosus]
MLAGIPTRQRLFCQLEEIDVLLKELLEKINRKVRFDDIEHIVLSLLEKDKGIKETMKTVSEQMELQKKIEKLRADCSNSDLQINACQKQLKKCELLLSTALYYSRQKLDAMVKAVKNPTDVDDLVRLAHRISCSYGVLAPDNWGPGDPRRPYPNKEEIRRGYLGHLDDSGNFLPTLQDAIAQFHSSVPTTLASVLATPAAAEITPTQSILSLSNQFLNSTSASSESVENASAYSPSVSVSGVNVVPSPSGTAPPTGSGNHWLDQQQQLRHLPSSSLTAILPSGSGVNAGIRPPRSGLQESPSSRAIWQQHTRQGLLGAHSSNPPQTKKRPHIEDPKMYSDTSSDDDGRFSDFTHHAL